MELLLSCSSFDEARSLVLTRLQDLESRGMAPRFRRYFGPHLLRIIKGRWPLDYWLVREFLVEQDFESYEDRLKRLEQVLDPEDLRRMFAELKAKSIDPPYFHSKLEAFRAEVDCAIFLSRIGAQDIKRLRQYGDWEFRLSGETLRAEVKNVQPHDFNVECIKDALFGEMSLVSSALRNYRSGYIRAREVNDRFRDIIVKVVHENLPSLLTRQEIDGTVTSITTADGSKVVCCWFVHSEAVKVEILTPTGDQCSIKFKRAVDYPDLVTANVWSSDNAWWGDPEPDWDEVRRKIRNRVSDALGQLAKISASLIFIRLNLHPMFENNVRMKKERLTSVLGPTLKLTDQPLVIEIPFYFGKDPFQLVFNEAARDFEKLWVPVTKPSTSLPEEPQR